MHDHHALDLDRYLVPFRLRRIPRYHYDVVVLGSGAGGGVAALEAADEGASVAVVAKDDLRATNTSWAQGGMAAVLGPEDSFASHAEDTLAVGCGMADPAVVARVVEGGPAAFELLRGIGARFDRAGDGALDLSREGGHRHPRIVHAQGDATGREIQDALAGALEVSESVDVYPELFAIDLLSDDEGRVVGVLSRNAAGELVAFTAKEVVVATGGAGQIYRETTNPTIATADGIAMGFRAGAAVRDLEFVQFHPTCLYIAGAARVLISEIVRGAGGVLRDRAGERFMPQHHPDAELAPRDVVSRAVFERMVATDDTNVYLDLSDVETDPHVAFPGISRICAFFGIDIARDPIPVRPGAHYLIGGLRVDGEGRTSVPGLRAVGEAASTGLHGANRMGSNSLLEAVVLGGAAGRAAARDARDARHFAADHVVTRERAVAPPGVRVNIPDLTYSLKSMMWRRMGVERSADEMRDALARFDFWARAVHALPLEDSRSVELVNMLTVARLATVGALAREESRGVHYRRDFPEPSEAWRAHLEQRPRSEGGRRVLGVELHREAVVPAGDAAPTESGRALRT